MKSVWQLNDFNFARVFLAIDRANDGISYIELEEATGLSDSSISKAVNELAEMGCIDKETVSVSKGRNIIFVFPTGHNCDFCTPTIQYIKG